MRLEMLGVGGFWKGWKGWSLGGAPGGRVYRKNCCRGYWIAVHCLLKSPAMLKTFAIDGSCAPAATTELERLEGEKGREQRWGGAVEVEGAKQSSGRAAPRSRPRHCCVSYAQ